METINENIKVFCRVRPIQEFEPATPSVKVSNNICTLSPTSSRGEQSFKFDGCFGPESTQCEVFDAAARSIVDSAIAGFNGTILAYGPTNSGKTFTMRGSPDNGGIIPRSVEYLLQRSFGSAEIWISYLQIYCESIYDLLDPNNDSQTDPLAIAARCGSSSRRLHIREKAGNVYVEGLSSSRIQSVQDLHEILARGDYNRATATTNANTQSSRSHAALIVRLASYDEDPNPEAADLNLDEQTRSGGTKPNKMKFKKESHLFLVDLAGSERASASEGRNYMRLEEAKYINLSLSALSNCMFALSEISIGGGGNSSHVPYRDSKLTRLLQGSLGGGSRTALLVNISPVSQMPGNSDEDTLNALRFAARASRVIVAAKVMRYVDYEALFGEVQKKLDLSEQTVRELELQLGVSRDAAIKAGDDNKMLRERIHELESALQAERGKQAKNTMTGHIDSTSMSAAASRSTGRNGVEDRSESSLDISNRSDSHGVEMDVELRQWRDKAERLSQELQSHQQLHQKYVLEVRTSQLQAQQEISELQDELRAEREKHLATVHEWSALKQTRYRVEKAFESRLQDLLAEIESKNKVIESLRDGRSVSVESQSALQRELDETRASMESMVTIEQVREMERLFLETVDRLSNRVKQLESQRREGSYVNSGANSATLTNKALVPSSDGVFGIRHATNAYTEDEDYNDVVMLEESETSEGPQQQQQQQQRHYRQQERGSETSSGTSATSSTMSGVAGRAGSGVPRGTGTHLALPPVVAVGQGSSGSAASSGVRGTVVGSSASGFTVNGMRPSVPPPSIAGTNAGGGGLARGGASAGPRARGTSLW